MQRPRRAKVACFACRKSKRGCDRTLPHCKLCEKRELSCHYPQFRGDTNDPSPDEERHYVAQITPTSQSDASSTSAVSARSPSCDAYSASFLHYAPTSATLRFIAPHFFADLPAADSSPHQHAHMQLAGRLGDIATVQRDAVGFFEICHYYLPIMSRKRFMARLLNPLSAPEPDFCLLILAMRMYLTLPNDVSQETDQIPGVELYRVVKPAFWNLIEAGVASLQILQAGLIVVAYEMSHAIAPAASITLGLVARIAQDNGYDKLLYDDSSESSTGRTSSWIEIEEKRRLWWSLLILERWMKIGNDSLRLVTPDPSFEAILPRDDTIFDEGQLLVEDAFRLSNGFDVKMGLFARLAQCTYLVGRVFEAKAAFSLPRDAQDADFEAETRQLRRTIMALAETTESEAIMRNMPLCSPAAVCYSLIMLLQEHDWFLNRTPLPNRTLWADTENAINRTFESTSGLPSAWNLDCSVKQKFPVFPAQIVYQTASCILKSERKINDGNLTQQIQDCRSFLVPFQKRWRLIAAYIKLLDFQIELELG